MKKPVLRVFSFFFFLTKRSRRTRVFFFFSFLPVLISLVFKMDQVFKATSASVMPTFTSIILLFELQFLILILALFFGTSICSEDIEGKTLSYITTRPVSKPAIVVGKYLAYTLITILMAGAGTIFSFLILNAERLLQPSLYLELFRALAVLSLGLMTYNAFFTFFGAVFRRAIFFGLIFGFGWENVIQYFPGSTQRFTIVHYLKSLLPYSGSKVSILTFRLEPTAPGLAVLALFLITAVFLGLACLVFSWKQDIPED